MLSKLVSTSYSIDNIIFNSNISTNGVQTLYTATGNITLNYTIISNNSGTYVQLRKNNNGIATQNGTGSQSGTVDLVATDYVSIYVYGDTPRGACKLYYPLITFPTKAPSMKKEIPTESKAIGNKAKATLFGMLPTGEWRDGN